MTSTPSNSVADDSVPHGQGRSTSRDNSDGDGAYCPSHPLWQIVLARTREFYREPEAIFWVYGFPLIMTVALGVAFRNPPRQEIAVAVEAGPAAELLATSLGDPQQASESEVTVEAVVLSAAESRRQLRAGKVALVVVPSAHSPAADATVSAEPAAPAEPAAGPASTAWNLDLQYVYDPTRPEGALARRAVDDRLQRAAGRRDVLSPSDQPFQEPGSRYIDFLVPGLLGGGLMGGGLWGVGFVVVELRVRNLLKRFVTTPMRKSHFLAGLIASRFVFAVTEVVLLLVFAHYAFGVPLIGSWLALAVLVVLGAWTFAGLGLLLCSRAKTIETASGVINLAMMPMYLVSGIFFSSDRFPDFAQPFIRLLPLTPLIDGLRQVMLEGATLWHLGPQVGLLLAWSVGTFVGALKLFRWV